MFDLGLGKTKTALDSIRWLKHAGRIHRVLVLVPNVVNLEGWRLEIAKHAPDLTASYIMGDKRERAEAWDDETDLCLCTYAGLYHLVCTKSAKKMRIDLAKLKKAQKLFDGIVWDECQALMSHRSLNFRIASQLSKNFRWRLGLTGTPLGRDPQVLWSQFYCVDRGEALGQTLGPFREAFFTSKEGWFGGVEYTFHKKREPQLKRMMNHSSIRYSSEECLDLPELVHVERPFVMPDEAWEYYSAILEQCQHGKEGMLDIKGVFVRLRQIASGFVSVEHQPSPLEENPKLESLLELLDELPPDEKVVVFNEFVWSGDRIEAALGKGNIARLYSGTKDKAKELRRFNLDPKCRAFVVNSQSGAQGLNLQIAPYVAFYESPVSPIVRRQAEKRCHRPGQSKRVFIYDLFAKNTVEQKILHFLAEGEDLFEALVDGRTSLAEKRRERL
jgi:SNF2 family DNA or RNA helicase